MNIVHAEYNQFHNSIDINYYNGSFFGLTVARQKMD